MIGPYREEKKQWKKQVKDDVRVKKVRYLTSNEEGSKNRRREANKEKSQQSS
jgi:hypothetical protein